LSEREKLLFEKRGILCEMDFYQVEMIEAWIVIIDRRQQVLLGSGLLKLIYI